MNYSVQTQFSLTMIDKSCVRSSALRDVKVGNNVIIIEPSNIYECTLDDNVFVGPFVEIQKGVTIGRSTKVQSHSFICELVTIGESCFIGHGVMFVNDRFRKGGPACGDRSLWERTVVGNNVSIGTGSTILPVSIVDHTVIGAGSVVLKDITQPGVYAGNPARMIKKLDKYI